LPSSVGLRHSGFAITVDDYRHFLETNKLERLIEAKLAEPRGGKISGAEIGLAIRTAIETLKTGTHWPLQLTETQHD
jgi:phosphoenolpyruvate synthase/pyruvate phosphate dikinase